MSIVTNWYADLFCIYKVYLISRRQRKKLPRKHCLCLCKIVWYAASSSATKRSKDEVWIRYCMQLNPGSVLSLAVYFHSSNYVNTVLLGNMYILVYIIIHTLLVLVHYHFPCFNYAVIIPINLCTHVKLLVSIARYVCPMPCIKMY